MHFLHLLPYLCFWWQKWFALCYFPQICLGSSWQSYGLLCASCPSSFGGQLSYNLRCHDIILAPMKALTHHLGAPQVMASLEWPGHSQPPASPWKPSSCPYESLWENISSWSGDRHIIWSIYNKKKGGKGRSDKDKSCGILWTTWFEFNLRRSS